MSKKVTISFTNTYELANFVLDRALSNVEVDTSTCTVTGCIAAGEVRVAQGQYNASSVAITFDIELRFEDNPLFDLRQHLN